MADCGASPETFLHFFEMLQELAPLWPRIRPGEFNNSTMTVLAQSKQKVKLAEVGEGIEALKGELGPVLLDTGAIHEDCPPGTLSVRWEKQRTKKDGEFGNQVTLAFESWSKRSIKIFSHGGIHMTGVKNLTEFQRVSQVVCGLLFAVGAVDTRMELGLPRVVLLNFNFAIGAVEGGTCELSLDALSKAILRELDIVAIHETESHPALMVEFWFREGEKTTAMIFRSGRVLITSRSQLAGVLASFRLICQLVNDNYDAVKASINLKPSQKKRRGYTLEGYPSGQALPCFKRTCR